MNEFRQYIRESKEFSAKEDVPVLFIPIIIKIHLLIDKNVVKTDNVLKNLIKKGEELVEKLPKNNLDAIKKIRPSEIFSALELECYQKDIKKYFIDMMKICKRNAISVETVFSKSLEIGELFDEFMESNEMKLYLASI